MANNFEKEVQGSAVYLEFRKPSATCQIILTPDGFGATEGVITSQFFRRVITDGVSKRRWKAYSIPTTTETKQSIEHGDPQTPEEVADQSILRLKYIADYLTSLANGGYTLVKDTPIYVEVTKEDLSAVRVGNLPAKLWTRVKSSRVALGFPEEPVDPRPAPATY